MLRYTYGGRQELQYVLTENGKSNCLFYFIYLGKQTKTQNKVFSIEETGVQHRDIIGC